MKTLAFECPEEWFGRHADIVRFRTVLEAAGYKASDGDITLAWRHYSERNDYRWIGPYHHQDARVLEVLLRTLKPAGIEPITGTGIDWDMDEQA